MEPSVEGVMGFRAESMAAPARAGAAEGAPAGPEQRESQPSYRELFAQCPVGLVVFDAEGLIIDVNSRFADCMGAAREKYIGLDLRGPTMDAAVHRMHDEIRRGEQSKYLGPFTSAVSGRRLSISLMGVPRYDASGAYVGGLAVALDPAEPDAVEKQLAHALLHDTVTGLPNRTLLKDRAEKALQQAKRMGRRLAIALISIDRLSEIDESLGRAATDQLMAAVAARLQRSIRASDTIARTGDNAIVVLLPEAGSTAATLSAVERIRRELATSWEIDGRSVPVSASIGIALYPDDAPTVDGLLQSAVSAMRRAQSHGGDGWEFFHQSMTAAAAARLALEAELRTDLAEGRFGVYYQPLVDASSGNVVGFEALARWHHRERGLLLPEEFIEVAEQSGLIVPLGTQVLHTACHQARAWNETRDDPLRVSVNLSPRELRQGGLADAIAQALDASGLPPHLLEIEITETSALLLPERAALMLADLRSLGVRVALDDFGTGYSSLSHLTGLPIDAVKIDRAFVTGLESSPKNAAVATAVIELAHSLGLTVVAEGIERPEQAAFMCAKRCDLLQGFLLSEPLPAGECEAAWAVDPAIRRRLMTLPAHP